MDVHGTYLNPVHHLGRAEVKIFGDNLFARGIHRACVSPRKCPAKDVKKAENLQNQYLRSESVLFSLRSKTGKSRFSGFFPPFFKKRKIMKIRRPS